MKNLIIMIACIATCVSNTVVFSQYDKYDFYHKNYDWKDPKPYKALLHELKESAIYLIDHQYNEVAVPQDLDPAAFNITHRAIYLHDNNAIEEFNQVSLPGGAIKVLVQKARVIKPDGTVKNLNESSILEQKDEEGNVQYKYFAFEGVEIGSTVEYIFITIDDIDIDGNAYTLLNSYKTKSAQFEVIFAPHMVFTFYPVNGIKEMTKDSTLKKSNRYYLHEDSLMPFKREKHSAVMALSPRMYYKFSGNTASGEMNLNSYKGIVANIQQSYYEAPKEKADKKALKKILSKIKVKGKTEEEKIVEIEDQIKRTYNVLDINYGGGEFGTYAFMLKNKLATRFSITKLFIQALKMHKINFNAVLTTDRNKNKMPSAKDKYEGSNFLNSFLIFFPGTKMYISPENNSSRYGFVPDELTETNGLFLTETAIADGQIVITGKVKYIEGCPMASNYDYMTAKVDFKNGIEKPNIHYRREIGGYTAQYYQYAVAFLNEEKLIEHKESVLEYLDDELKVKNGVYTNFESSQFGKVPIIAEGDLENTHFMQDAGNKFIFEVGKLIGPQAEMYDSVARTLPIEEGHCRKYSRKFEIEIPAGKTVKNLEKLNVNEVMKGENPIAGFTSSYTQNGNVISIVIEEFYSSVFVPLEKCAEYKKVYNAAADYNKVVLLIE
jgi:Domain of Unknown Function with PDB structure (DUF3857)